MKSTLDQIVASPLGAFVILLLAASLEVFGDACFQSGMYRTVGMSGATRGLWMLAGVTLLGFYGWFVNVPPWDFGKLLGVYVALFFLVAQIVARVRFGQHPTVPIYVGGSLIVLGGLVITFWKG
jgi:small multidrug resistance family-3 protein